MIAKLLNRALKTISILFSLIFIVQAPMTALASELPEEQTSVQSTAQIAQVDDNTLRVTDADGESLVTVNETDGVRTITIVDSDTGKTDYIQYDEKSNTVYSSFTGETIDLSNHAELSPKDSFYSERLESSYETKYISYAQIKSIIGTTATAVAVIGAILYFVPGAQSIGGAASAVGTIVGAISQTVSPSNSHGIKLTIKVTKYYRTRMGRRQVYKITRAITAGALY